MNSKIYPLDPNDESPAATEPSDGPNSTRIGSRSKSSRRELKALIARAVSFVDGTGHSALFSIGIAIVTMTVTITCILAISANNLIEQLNSEIVLIMPATSDLSNTDVIQLLEADPQIASTEWLSQIEVSELLSPWLGVDASSIPSETPSVFYVTLINQNIDVDSIIARLKRDVPTGRFNHDRELVASLLVSSRILVGTLIAIILMESIVFWIISNRLTRRETLRFSSEIRRFSLMGVGRKRLRDLFLQPFSRKGQLFGLLTMLTVATVTLLIAAAISGWPIARIWQTASIEQYSAITTQVDTVILGAVGCLLFYLISIVIGQTACAKAIDTIISSERQT